MYLQYLVFGELSVNINLQCSYYFNRFDSLSLYSHQSPYRLLVYFLASKTLTRLPKTLQTTLTLAQLDRAAACASPNMGASSTASCYKFVLHIIWKGAGQFHDFIVACKDDLRRKVWPLLLSLDPNKAEPAPELSELQSHPEYQQVQINVFFRLISRILWTIRFFCGVKKYRFVYILH